MSQFTECEQKRTVILFISQCDTEKGIFFPPKQSTAFYNASNYRMYSYSISLVVVYDKIIRLCMNDILDLFEENKCLMAGKHTI